KMSMDIAGFTPAQADILRYGVGKKKHDVLERMQTLFYDGAKARGYSEEEIDHNWSIIINGGDYQFNLSHAIAYAKITFITSWLLATYPEAFLSNYINRYKGVVNKIACAISTANKLNIRVCAPSIR